MATKLNDRKTGGRTAPGGKRVTFERGQPKSTGRGLPMKTSDVRKE